MSTTLLGPILTAEARAVAEAIDGGKVPANGAKRPQLVALLKAVIPDVVETPNRMKRLNDALGEWLVGGARSWEEVEAVREEFQDIFDTQTENVARVRDVAAALGFAEDELERLQAAREALARLHTLIFERWQPFTHADHQAALAEVHHGKTHDLDEVIRELQRCAPGASHPH